MNSRIWAQVTGTSCLEEVQGDTGPVPTTVERWCEVVASAAVLPQFNALRAAVRTAAVAVEPDFALVQELASEFNVSLRATATSR